MVLYIFKWWMILTGLIYNPDPFVHPYYVSVTEIVHNAKAQTLEMSCKLFTDDFEQTLKKATGQQVDLLNPAKHEEMKPLVKDYISEHLEVKADGRDVKFQYLGYERDEEGIIAYFEAGNIPIVHKIEVINNLLYEFHPNQIGFMHVTVNGKRKSTKLDNPEKDATFIF